MITRPDEAHDHPVIYVVGWSWSNDEENLPATDWDALAAYVHRPDADAACEAVRAREHAAFLVQHADDPATVAADDPCGCGPEVLVVPWHPVPVLGARPSLVN